MIVGRGRRRRGGVTLTDIMRSGIRALVAVLLVVVFPLSAAAQPTGPVGGPRLGEANATIWSGAPGAAPPPEPLVGAWLVADAGTGAVLAARNPHQRLRPASTLKTLTALTLLPRLDPGATYTAVDADALQDGSRVGIVPGTTYSIKSLFEGLLLASGNDAAHALATAAGGLDKTVALMNETAQELQAYDTVAANPSGLDTDIQLTSVYDLALIARAGLVRDDFRTYVGTQRSYFAGIDGSNGFEIQNHNKLLANYPGAIGVKTGYTSISLHSIVGAATRDGRTLIVAVLGGQAAVWPDAAALLDWGFAQGASAAAVGTLVGPRPAEPTPTATPSAEAVLSAAADPSRPGQSQQALRAWEPESWEYVAVGATVLLGAGAAAAGVRSRRRRQRRQSRVRAAAQRVGQQSSWR
jgi:serine-type D-Ala-D-Ala carboxypeptidase (penicillin-binding protein 5/6)